MARTHSWLLVGGGFALGLAIGGAMTIGVLIGQRAGDPGASVPGLGELKLKAMASHGGETFAIATGQIDDEVEGLYTLDFLTGDLQCFVVNPRTGGLGGWFKANVANDLSIERGKKPSYLMVTGQITSQGAYGNQRPAASLCYVADANTGEIACYSFPWAKAATAVGVVQAQPMTRIYKGKARSIAIRGK